MLYLLHRERPTIAIRFQLAMLVSVWMKFNLCVSHYSLTSLEVKGDDTGRSHEWLHSLEKRIHQVSRLDTKATFSTKAIVSSQCTVSYNSTSKCTVSSQ